MADYAFYAAFLRFFARRTDREDKQVAAMMDVLEDIAAQVEPGETYTVAAGRLHTAARGLAGVAGFLQQHILPETTATGNAAGEAQVRWVIDTSMEAVARLTVHAETTGEEEPCTISLPPPPQKMEDEHESE